MQKLENEIANISTLFPLMETEVIADFMTSIPREVEYLRIPLTLTHLYQLEDSQNASKLKKENIQHARLIHELFPIYSVEKISKKLKKYGNIPNRCRLVIRNILKSKEDEIQTVLLNVNSSIENLFRKQCTPVEHMNGSFDRSEEFVGNFPDESEDGDCDIQESTSPTYKPNQSKDSQETIITTPTYPSVIEEPTCPERPDILSESAEQETKLEDISYVWVDEAPHRHLQEKFQPGAFDEPQHSARIDTCDNSFPICAKVVSYAEGRPLLLEELSEPDDNVFERFKIESFKEEKSSKSSLNLPSSLPEELTEIQSNSRNIEVDETEQVFLKGVHIPPRTATREAPPELALNEPARKKLKTDRQQFLKNQAPETYDLIEVLAGVTSKSRRSIADHCLRFGIDVYREPPRRKMDRLIQVLLGEVSDDHYESADDDLDNSDVVLIPDEMPQTETNHLGEPHRTNPAAIDFADGAVADRTNNNVVFRVMEIFPDADPTYIRKLYSELPDQAGAESVLSEALIEIMLSVDNYPKRPIREPTPEEDVDFEVQAAFVSELLPDADPSFLKMKVAELTADELKNFVAEALEKKDYPTLKEYQRKQQLSAQMRQYTVEFSVDNFVKLVPDPISTFEDPNRNVTMCRDDITYVHQFFKNKFCRIAVKFIYNEWSKSKNRPYICYKALMNHKEKMKTNRPKGDLKTLMCKNIPLLQELAFIENETEILAHINELKNITENERVHAKNTGLMLTCNCCFDDEVMPYNTHTCNNNCVFCRQCIIKGVEVLFGEGKLVFPCLGDCGSNFSLQTLQTVLPPNFFSKVAQKQAVAEVKAAEMEDLEFCPFCDFATIPPGPPETDKIFVCQNPDCLKESCRLCREPSHVPLRCDEVEKDEDVKKRVYIENKMTEALLRKCWKCGISFYKEEGCNKMTCSCGSHMCYICGQPVTDYKHFNGIGGDRTDLCPLYSDTNAVNQQNVLKGAQAAKEEIGVAGGSELKHDPASDVKQHFEERAKKLPVEAHLQHLQRLNELAANARLQNQAHGGLRIIGGFVQDFMPVEVNRNVHLPLLPRDMGPPQLPAALLVHAQQQRRHVHHRHAGHPPRPRRQDPPFEQLVMDAIGMMHRDDNRRRPCNCPNCRRH